MKFLSRTGSPLLLSILALASFVGAQGGPARKKSPPDPPAEILKVRVLVNQDTPALEITASRPIAPVVNKLADPPRLQVDLPNALMSVESKTIEVNNARLTTVHLDQLRKKPPSIRITMDLPKPGEYASNTSGNQLVIRIGDSAAALANGPGIPNPGSTVVANAAPPSVSSFTTGVRPVAIPIIPGASGALILAGDRMANGSAVTAGADTTILRLGRGGEVHVCPGTTVSVTAAEKGSDLMLGMSTGALETHYRSGSASDSVLTPDFRILLAGPGEFDFAISADSRGNTCVRALPGNSNPVTVAELMGSGTYVVKPDEQVVFHSGQMSMKDNNIPLNCGCPPAPAQPVLRASNEAPPISEKNLPPSFHLPEPGKEAKPVPPAVNTSGLRASGAPPSQVAMTVLPPPNANLPSNQTQVQVDVDAPLVFRASEVPPSQAAPIPETERLPLTYSRAPQAPQATVLPPPARPNPQAEPQPPRKQKGGVFSGIKGFFSKIFH
jgi:hypothetical protein